MHPLLHKEEQLFLAQVEIFLRDRNLHIGEWSAVRNLVDAVAKARHVHGFGEVAFAIFRSGELGGPWQYPPPNAAEKWMHV